MPLMRTIYVRLYSDCCYKLLHSDAHEVIIKLLFPWIIRDKEKCVKRIYFIKIKQKAKV
ncbi:hypothetical protein BCV72DRAFT_235526 [Rhizopus microsporus var. microsporus]|uniref:Uncharacterized protein n=2 Tax=Rhizopus microsporus TaxID=58291 RepID=A0A2G4SJ94_RHIZD|nr:uncharacterized protein RHIMIDRAFT_267884 [Rhizopus microsporus ATCC 52813]XP_023462556.1 uncharacterized protein RHIMIDRAFT_267922 [Rhizopus microsporus ATCC 52813]ORE01921.1 hypothetical protein BCV72DRAFT_235508 [Rhizopus microsporus var. microsporus]ORE01935.1 hypothetical protein BCV72DRAFT_235526 [Rhizopus microsporus var. microsporus]PHZ08837.1 hypothetical protein RHIMIDRAFT_267884 [Rhizopus microsporus ATCC 52813]PHZ08848.1 hypothetical protein RHIMIDRAFT_267922 [Rhizopus microspor